MKRESADMPAADTNADAASEPTFEQLLAELEAVIERLEDGRTGLSQALGDYQRGIQVLRLCHQQLDGARRQVELLTGVDAQGNPVVQPFDDRASVDAETTADDSASATRAARSRRTQRRIRTEETDTPTRPADPPGLF